MVPATRPAAARFRVEAGRVAEEADAFVRRHHAWLAPLLFLIGSLITGRHAVTHMASHISATLPIQDATQFFWTMWWWPHALLHLQNPFITHALWVPDSFDMASVTGIPVPSLLMAPVTALFGPIVSYNVIALAAPVLDAWLAYRLCLRVSRAPAPAILGGWLYGFSSYFFSQLTAGHLNLTLAFAPPALLLLTLRRFDGSLSVRRYIVLAAIVLIAQMGSNPEILFSTTVLGAVALICALAFYPAEVRRRLLRLIPPAAGAYVLAGIVTSPFLYYLVTGPALSKGVYKLYYADLDSYFFPTPITGLLHQSFLGVSSDYFAGYGETGTYIGVFGVIILLAYAIKTWASSATTRVLMITVFVAFAFSFGTSLDIDGRATIWMPYSLVGNLPGFTEASPVRLGLYVELGLALTASLWLALPNGRPVWRWIIALVAVVILLPNTSGALAGNPPRPVYDSALNVPGSQFYDPPFFTQGIYKRYLTRGEVILPIPYGASGPSMLWQATAHGYFRMAGGYLGYVPHDYFVDPVFDELYNLIPFSNPIAAMRSFLKAHHVGAIVISDGQQGPWPGLFTRMGMRWTQVGSVIFFQVPPGLRS